MRKLAFGILILMMVACRGGEEPITTTLTGNSQLQEQTVSTMPPIAESTNTPKPTETAVSEPTATPEPPLPAEKGIILGDLVTNPVGGYAIATMPDYEIEQIDDTVWMFVPVDKDDKTAFRYIVDGGLVADLSEQKRADMEDLIQDEGAMPDAEVLEREPVEMFGLSGVDMLVQTTEDTLPVILRLIMLRDAERYLIFYGVIETSRWENEGVAICEALLSTLVSFPFTSPTSEDSAFGEPIVSLIGGYRIASLANYGIAQSDNGVTTVYPVGESDDSSFMYTVQGGLTEIMDDEQRRFVFDMIAGEDVLPGEEMLEVERSEIELQGLSGITAVIVSSDGDLLYKQQIIVLVNETQWFMLTGNAEFDQWENESAFLFGQLLATVDFFHPLPPDQTP